ncbi:MAG: hypothetical protein JKY92_05875 [Magnetovibrio sp.]|nr:hypothetical protein [Magnetovibrio sp.]
MWFKKEQAPGSPMDNFINRHDLALDERAILDVYLTGILHGVSGINTVCTTNTLPPVVKDFDLDVAELKAMIDTFLKERQDMKHQPLGLCAVMAVMQRFGT